MKQRRPVTLEMLLSPYRVRQVRGKRESLAAMVEQAVARHYRNVREKVQTR